MVDWKELHIQSNLPLIVLAVSFICVVIIGFLEFKKLSIKIEDLSGQINSLKVKGTNVIEEEKGKVEKKEKKIEEKVEKKEEKVEENNTKKEENNEMINEMNHEMNNEMNNEMIPPSHPMDGAIIMEGGIPMEGMMMGMPNIASMIIQGGPPMMPMGGPPMYEEDIDGGKLDIQEEKEDNLSEVDEDEVDNLSDSECSISGSESDIGSESELETDDESDVEVGKIELIKGSGKVEDIKEVDKTSSIKELKDICQKLGISSSGNKESLIKRINAKNKK